MPANTSDAVSPDELRSVLVKPANARELVGLEIETAVVDPQTGLAAPYKGSKGVEALLAALTSEFDSEPIYDGEHLTGFFNKSGPLLTLEHGGALEYAPAPADNLTTAIDGMRETMTRISETARWFDLAVLPGANMPFNDPTNVQWVPKPRGLAMREFFTHIGDPGSGGALIMGLSLATQATLDYVSEEDLAEKVRMQAAASPVVAAMFVNSPMLGGRITNWRSVRSRWWQKADPRRCGLLPPALRERMSPDDFVDWALNVPMIYYKSSDGAYRMVDRPFADVLADGFADGRHPTREDWISHLSQVWTDVRVRQTLELRSADGPPYPAIPAVPALWVGLSYHPESRREAWNLLKEYSRSDLQKTIEEVPTKGLHASLSGVPVRELGRELVRLADAGIVARVQAGIEDPRALQFLDPVKEILETGVTFADRVISRWDKEFLCDPARYVAAYHV